MELRRAIIPLFAVLAQACFLDLSGLAGQDVPDGGDAGAVDAGPVDAGPRDASAPDAAMLDAGPMDAGAFDAGPMDSGMPDAGIPDAGAPDAGMPDAGAPDAGMPDAGAPDAGMPDGGAPDAGAPDAGAPDAGAPDAGAPDAGMPDAGPSPCASLEPVVPGFLECAIRGSQCELYYDAPGASARSCDDICALGGKRCLEAYGDGSNIGDPCARGGAQACSATRMDSVCVCAP